MAKSTSDGTPLAMSPPDTVEKVTAAFPGVKQSDTGKYPVPTDPENHQLIMPDERMQYLTPGSKILICGKEVTVLSTGMRIIDSDRHGPQRYITKVGLNSFVSNRSAQLYVDREPFLLNETRGPVWKIPAAEVKIDSESSC